VRNNKKLRIRFLILTILLVSLAGYAPLHAHTTLLDETPERASKVSDIDEIELTFASELVNDGKAKIYLATIREGEDIPLGETVFISDFVIKAEVPELPEPGEYVIRYMVTSFDGDLNDGGYAFELLEPKGNSATWLLLGIGVVALMGMSYLLRSKKTKNKKETDNG